MVRSGLWIRGPVVDGFLALSWVPFALAAHAVEGDVTTLRTVVAAVMFLSFAHQPLTMPLVYGSPWRLQSHRRIFLWAPLVSLAVVTVFSHISLGLLVVVGALWNAEHTLMQRYGITRIYGRRAGDERGKIERWMLVGWLLIPVLVVIARGQVLAMVDTLRVKMDATSATTLDRPSREARMTLVPVVAVTLVLTVRWLRAEFAGHTHANPAKRLYVASTAAMFIFGLFDPLAALVGFVGSHSVEYFAIVNQSVATEARHPGPLGRVIRLRYGVSVFWTLCAVSIVGLFVLVYHVATPDQVIESVLVLGSLHFFYDSFIWKLRKPEVAASLGSIRTLA